jgi:peptidoglycan/LPS O-acetylase OafA/YrhL
MKVFKTADVVIQLFILCAIAINFFSQGFEEDAILWVIGFGAFQVIGSLIHLFLKYKKTWWRISYSLAGVIILFMMLFIKLNVITEDNFIVFILVLAPAMGFYYVILSCVETYKLYALKNTNPVFIED